MKASRHKLYRELVPLPQPNRPWQDIAIDFITGLPPSIRRRKAYNAILVVVDRFLKIVRYIAYTIKINVLDLANRLIEEIFSKFKVPRSIVSDRGSIFMLKYWSILYYYLTVRRYLSTIFYL
jgi:hypothetical protein